MRKWNSNSALVRILKGQDAPCRPEGAGFLASPRHVVTCAHVVAGALGVEAEGSTGPSGTVVLDFPLLEHCPRIRAAVVRWFPVKRNAVHGEPEDIAILEISVDSPLPPSACPAPLLLLPLSAFDERRRVSMCGFPGGIEDGDRRNGETLGLVGTGHIQIDFEVGRRTAAPGFSGTPVWDAMEKSVCGIITGINSRAGETSAYMIPAATLVETFPELDRYSRPPNPYKGLEAFRENDAPFFFGRKSVVETLAETLRTQPFVPVIGSSGSGKSSLIYAGLMPKLRASDEWLIRDFRPKNDPFYNLSLSLVPLLYEDKLEQIEKTKELSDKFSRSQIEISDIVEMIGRDHPRKLLLFADQFEELFTANPEKSVQRRFMDLLVKSAFVSPPPFVFLFTMRADFMSRAVEYAPFATALDRHKPKILSSMNEAELTAAIENPAKKLGVTLESGLTERILQDLGNEPGNLPLLEFALTQLWEKQHFRTLTHEAYNAIGGVREALARHADSVLEGYNPEERMKLRQIFIQLVRPGEGTEDTRQVAFRNQFDDEKWNFVKRIADERLVVTGRNEANERETVEVVHEALIENWKPLRKWMDEDRSFRLWQNNLRLAISDWEGTERDEDALLRGVRLADAEERLERREMELAEDEIVFIRKSRAAWEREKASRERERRERGRLRRRIRRAGTAVAVVLLAIMGGWVWREAEQGKTLARSLADTQKARQLAEENEREASEKLAEAQHNLGYVFVEKAERELEGKNFNAARLYALHALNRFDLDKAEPQRTRAIGMVLNHSVYPLLFSSPDGIHRDDPVFCVAYSPDGKTLASGSADNTVRLWDAETGGERARLEGHGASVYSVSFSPDGKTLASGSDDGTVRLWDAETGEERARLEGHGSVVSSVGFSPDGKTLASGSWDKTVRLWDAETGGERARLEGHGDSVYSVIFSPDGNILASGSNDNIIRLWDLSFYQDMKDRQVTETELQEAERRYNLKLVDLQLRPIPPERNLYGTKPQPPN